MRKRDYSFVARWSFNRRKADGFISASTLKELKAIMEAGRLAWRDRWLPHTEYAIYSVELPKGKRSSVTLHPIETHFSGQGEVDWSVGSFVGKYVRVPENLTLGDLQKPAVVFECDYTKVAGTEKFACSECMVVRGVGFDVFEAIATTLFQRIAYNLLLILGYMKKHNEIKISTDKRASGLADCSGGNYYYVPKEFFERFAASIQNRYGEPGDIWKIERDTVAVDYLGGISKVVRVLDKQ